MSILNVNKINPVGGGSTVTIAGIASVTNAVSVGNSVTATTYYGSGTNLTGIDATKIETGNTKVETIDTGSDGHIKFTTEGSERARILADGKFGIGIAGPTSKLYVNGVSTNDIITARAADTNGASVINILAEGTTGISRIKFSDTAGTDGQISYTHTDRALTFAAGGTTERLRISSEGYVTKPAHPCFDVVRSGGNVSSGNYIIYNTVNVNNGAHYNASTGKFTAPVAGHYFFSYGTIKNTSSVTRLYFRKNQSNFPTGADRHLRMDSGQGGYGDNGAMTIVVNLAVGDEIQIYVGAGEAYGATQEYCYFNGFLLG